MAPLVSLATPMLAFRNFCCVLFPRLQVHERLSQWSLTVVPPSPPGGVNKYPGAR